MSILLHRNALTLFSVYNFAHCPFAVPAAFKMCMPNIFIAYISLI